jgi:hypothetical protein
MRLLALFICELLASRGWGGRRKGNKSKGGEPALTSGTARPNPNVASVNNLNGIGCQIVELNDDKIMAIGGHYLKKFTNCGRCAKVTCVGNACPTDGSGSSMSVVARIVTQTTISDDDKDVELNVAAWTELMGARATLPGMSVTWQFASCPEPDSGRKKIYIHEDTNDKTYIVQPIGFTDPIKFMKFKNSVPKSKFSKPKSPLKGKLDFFGYIGKVKGKAPMQPPIFVDIMMADDDGTRIKTKMTSWEPGKFSFPDGLPPEENVDGPTQTKNDNMNFHVLGDIFGGAPTKTKTTKAPPAHAPPATTPKVTRPPRTKKPKPPKPVKPAKGGGKKQKKVLNDEMGSAPSFSASSFFGGPASVQESESKHNALDAFVFDMLQPFQMTEAPTRAPTTTTTQAPKVTDIGAGMKEITGVGAPASATSGSCNIKEPKDKKLYAAINKKLNSNACNMCVFIYCPTFSGCAGKPLKIQIVDEFNGEADFALSSEAFRQITGKTTKKEKEALYRSTFQLLRC